MSFADPTLAAAMSFWGEAARLQREPPVTLTGVYAAPVSLTNLGAGGALSV